VRPEGTAPPVNPDLLIHPPALAYIQPVPCNWSCTNSTGVGSISGSAIPRGIDGYKRIAALQQLGRDTVEAVAWPMGEAEALLLERSLRFSEQETALEQGWLLAEMEQRFAYGLDEMARRFAAA
jgi:hypothetical protein